MRSTLHKCLRQENRIKRTEMTNNRGFLFLMRAWRDRRGQDLIEYALMAGFLAVAAGAIMPGVSSSISTVMSDVASVMNTAGEPGHEFHHR
jgi:pilus assembly protein Flp/PilA